MKHAFFLVITFALISCNGSGGSSAQKAVEPAPEVVPNSSIFSLWKADNGSSDLDFSSYQYNVQGDITLANCNIKVLFEDQTDTDEADFLTMKLSNGTWDGTGINSGCSDLNGTWMMAIEGDKMEMCAPPTWEDCYTYTKE